MDAASNRVFAVERHLDKLRLAHGLGRQQNDLTACLDRGIGGAMIQFLQHLLFFGRQLSHVNFTRSSYGNTSLIVGLNLHSTTFPATVSPAYFAIYRAAPYICSIVYFINQLAVDYLVSTACLLEKRQIRLFHSDINMNDPTIFSCIWKLISQPWRSGSPIRAPSGKVSRWPGMAGPHAWPKWPDPQAQFDPQALLCIGHQAGE